MDGFLDGTLRMETLVSFLKVRQYGLFIPIEPWAHLLTFDSLYPIGPQAHVKHYVLPFDTTCHPAGRCAGPPGNYGVAK
jgi:hypothetical protein